VRAFPVRQPGVIEHANSVRPLAQFEIARIYTRKNDSAKGRAQYRHFSTYGKALTPMHTYSLPLNGKAHSFQAAPVQVSDFSEFGGRSR
jgi:hypothetical protein